MLVALVAGGPALADCTYYKLSGVAVSDVPAGPNREAVAAAWIAWASPPAVCDSNYVSGGSDGLGYIDYESVSSTCTPPYSRKSFNAYGTGACPADPCEYTTALNELGPVVREGTGSTAGTFCADYSEDGVTIQSCRVTVKGVVARSGERWSAQVQFSGESCGGGDSDVGDDSAPNCASSSAGMFCASRAKSNCGTINGQSVCLDKIPDGTCEFLSDGGMVCAAGTENPPAPDDGAGGPVTPDGGMDYVDNDGVVHGFDYYGPTTVGGSAGGASGASPGTSAGGGQTGPGGSSSAPDGADPGEICGKNVDGSENCYGSVPQSWTECLEDVGQCVTGIVEDAWGSITEEIELLGVVAGLADAFAVGGSCPVANITLFGETYDLMESVCEVSSGVDSLLALVFQVAWSLFALRIILKAQ